MKQPIPFGKYYLLERINMGGMAEVFRAKAYGVEGFERLVAVKRILPNIAEDKEFIRMFIDEAKIAVQLNHANIAQVFDLGRVETSYYISLEHIHGRDLRAIFDRCRKYGEPMPVAQACFSIMKVCEGLDYAHNKRNQAGLPLGLVHRDVSPQNVLVSFEGEVKIIDFGIAKAAGRGSKTQAGILKGKFGYMSPEQVRGLPIDRRSDVFSTGIVLYELLTGERLFVGESDFSTLEKVRNVEILPPSTYNRRIPEDLERIVLKSLAKDPDDRYQNAIDLHDDLQAFVYTAGEFYSRKDLASWMKSRFAKEIEAETAKLEAYRKLRPPGAPPPSSDTAFTEHGDETTSSRVADLSDVGYRRGAPPPIPGRAGPTVPLRGDAHRPPDDWSDDVSIYDDDSLFTDSHATSAGHSRTESLTSSTSASVVQGGRTVRTAAGLSHGASRASAVRARPRPSSQQQRPVLSELTPMPSVEERPWTAGSPPAQVQVARAPSPVVEQPRPRSEPPPYVAGPHAGGQPLPHAAIHHPPGMSHPSSHHQVVAHPSASHPVAMPQAAIHHPPMSHPGLSHPSAQYPVVRAMTEPMPYRRQTSHPVLLMPPRRPRAGLLGALVIAVLLAGGGVAAAVFLVKGSTWDRAGASSRGGGGQGGEREVAPPSKPSTAQQPPSRPRQPEPAVVADPGRETGLDLSIEPAGATASLDGRAIDEPLPAQLRNIPPGEHILAITPPPGYAPETRRFQVVEGRAEPMAIKLAPIEVTVVFQSEPPGARVSLQSGGTRQRLGRAPVSARLDPKKEYQAIFEKTGYETVTRTPPLGEAQVTLSVTLEKARDSERDRVSPRDPALTATTGDVPVNNDATGTVDAGTAEEPPRGLEDDPAPVEPSEGEGEEQVYGTLQIGSKPPCHIFIDGTDTGKKTPQRNLRLSPGTHRVTLVNAEYDIRESFRVTINSGETTRAIKDLSDQLP